ncbi:MAG: translation elongation factor Ts, partial [Clostridia bacterium]|nr:translation elongation factor Ts [Clostridia bacterium]
DVDALMTSKYMDTDLTVEAKLQEMIFSIGEKISIRRFVLVDGVVSTYIHGMGSIGVIVKFDVDADTAAKAEFVEFSKNIALQVGAYPVAYLDKESVPASVVAEETEIIVAAIKNDPANAKKPENIIREKMVPGKLNKFYEGNCLTEMDYVKEDKMKVGEYVANTAKALGASIKLAAFFRFEKGEGIQKREDNFAEEIAKLTGQN